MAADDEFLDRLLATPLGRRAVLERLLLGASAIATGATLTSLPGTASATTLPLAIPPTSETASAAAERVISGRAWDDFCEVLRLAGQQIEHWSKDATPLDRAEWYRYLTRLARNGLERFVENGEPARPRLRLNAWRTSMNVTNPDQDHLLAELYPQHDYVITGHRGTVPYFIAAAWSWPEKGDVGARDWAKAGIAGLKELNPAVSNTSAFISSDQIKFDSDGRFTLYVGPTKKEGNWLALAPNCTGLLIRIVYHERAKEQAPQMEIERADKVAPRAIRPEELSLGLARAGQEVLGYAELVRAWWYDNLGKRPNQLRYSQQLYLQNGGVADRQFAFGTWKKQAAEALVLQFTPPECEYWIFQLCNLWQENLDNYEDGQGYKTKFNSHYEEDGRIRLIVAESDPGIGGNWIDSYGHIAGLMGLRLIKTTGAPAVTAHLVDLQELKKKGWKMLTAETAIVSGEVVP